MAFQELVSANQVTDKLSGWWETFVDNLPNLGVALAVLIVSFLASKLVYRVVLKLIYKRINQTSVTQLIARTAATVVVLGGLILALVSLNLGQALTAMLSAAGVSGLVIGLALQGTLSNLISGIVLSFRKNISIGDWIESNGYAGEVTDINLNYFVMREADNNIIVLPNRKIMEVIGNPDNSIITNDIEKIIGRPAKDFQKYANEMASSGVWSLSEKLV